MKKLRKWTAMVLALMLMLTMVPWTTKAEPAPPDRTSSLIVKGVEKGATVTAYKLTEAEYGESNTDFQFIRYKNVLDGIFKNPGVPTTEEWKALLKKPVKELGAGIPLTWEEANTQFKSEPQGAGLYMILVTNADGTVYNPMLVGLSYSKDAQGEQIAGGTISVPANFELGKDPVLYAKKSEVTLTKTTKDPSDEPQSTVDGKDEENKKGNGLGLGEKPTFTIETTIPSYATTDKNLKFNITDTLDEGLKVPAKEEIKVKVGGMNIETDAAKVEVTVTGHVITVNFTEAYLKELGKEGEANRKVEITYASELLEKATSNFKANENNVSLTYTNDPKTDGPEKTITDKTYHYTFDIDGLLNGEGSEKSHELTKHKDLTDKDKSWKDKPLEGAEFGLFDKDPSEDTTAQKLQVVTTDESGRMNFKKLDEGVYYLKETAAPNGYSLNTTVYKVEIKADYNSNGTLKSYSIVIDDKSTTTFKAVDKAQDTTDGTADGVITETDTPTMINNTPIPRLPETGGMGTYLFTGIGVALLAGAAVMITALRKKNTEAAR